MLPLQLGETVTTHLRVRRAETDLSGWASRIQLSALRDALGPGLPAHAEGGNPLVGEVRAQSRVRRVLLATSRWLEHVRDISLPSRLQPSFIIHSSIHIFSLSVFLPAYLQVIPGLEPEDIAAADAEHAQMGVMQVRVYTLYLLAVPKV